MPPATAHNDEPISSVENPLVRLVRSLQAASGRRRYGAFLVEGLRVAEAAVQNASPLHVLHAPGFGRQSARERAVLRLAQSRGAAVRAVTDRVLAYVADTVTPQGVVAVMPTPEPDVSEGEPLTGLTLLLDGVSDPGNTGTLLRSAAGAGVDRVWCARGTVDLYAPKVVRAAAGAHFQCRLATDLAWGTIRALVPEGTPVLVADASASRRYWDVDWTRPSVLVLSREAHGASGEARALATDTVSIPITGIESLNVGVAGSIMLFEALRQRLLKEGHSHGDPG